MGGRVGEQARDGPDWGQAGGVYWDAVTERWLDAHPQRTWRRHSDAINESLLERWLPHGLGSVLKTDLFDEAVSTGLFPVLSRHAARVVGVDDSAAIVAAAAARRPELVARHADVRHLPFDAAEFDAVVSNSTLDHFDSRADIVVALRELARVLRPGGTLVLTLDNPWHPLLAVLRAVPRRHLNRAWGRVGGASSRVGLLPYYVGATLSLRTVRRILVPLGFRVTDTDAVVHVPRVLAVLVAGRLDRRAEDEARDRFLRVAMAFERGARWPTRYLTGHFVAVRAIRQ